MTINWQAALLLLLAFACTACEREHAATSPAEPTIEQEALFKKVALQRDLDVDHLSKAFLTAIEATPIFDGWDLRPGLYVPDWDWHIDCGLCAIEAGKWRIYPVPELLAQKQLVLSVWTNTLTREPSVRRAPSATGVIDCTFDLTRTASSIVGTFRGCAAGELLDPVSI